MPIPVRCKCGRSFLVADKVAGQTGTCGACGALVLIPLSSSEISKNPPPAVPGQASDQHLPLDQWVQAKATGVDSPATTTASPSVPVPAVQAQGTDPNIKWLYDTFVGGDRPRWALVLQRLVLGLNGIVLACRTAVFFYDVQGGHFQTDWLMGVYLGHAVCIAVVYLFQWALIQVVVWASRAGRG